MHDKIGPDEFSSWACIRLDRLARGIRFVHLMDVKGSPTTGALLADVDYVWNVPLKTAVAGS
jgi:phosphatidylinositol phospholipase C delta